MAYHKPVLLSESIEGLNIKPKGIYVDLTFGGGGHSREVLNKLGNKGRLLAFDQDHDAKGNLPDDKRVTFIEANFRYLRNFLRYHNISEVDGILADLGISSHQIDKPERGFSFRTNSKLDMRMNRSSGYTAAKALNESSENELIRIFRTYGEINNAGRVARTIVAARKNQTIATTDELEIALANLIPKYNSSKFLAKLYQALRIEVNQEMEALEEMLVQTLQLISTGGRLVVISYHSLEDRLVKNYMRSGNLKGDIEKDFYGKPLVPWKLINRNVIIPSDEELAENKRARSAKLRIAEKI